MSKSRKSSLLEDSVTLLVRHFGVERVHRALEKASVGSGYVTQQNTKTSRSLHRAPSAPPVVNALKSVRESDPERHRLLDQFYENLKTRSVLPQAQDIRHFAQQVGLKEIRGKSRRDMIPPLMRFMLDRPLERLKIDLQSAKSISEAQRQQGFSILADKLLKP